MRPRALVSYLTLQGVLIGGFCFVPDGATACVFWQVAVGWLAAGHVAREVRRGPLRAQLVRVMVTAGIFLNTSGILVQYLEDKLAGPMVSPHPADVLFLALYPCAIAGLATIVHRRSAAADTSRLVTSTIGSALITVGIAIVAWKKVIAAEAAAGGIGPLGLLITILYPMGDLVLLTLTLRLLLGGTRNGGVWLMLTAVLALLVADMGWVIPLGSGVPLSPLVAHLLRATTLAAFVCMSAAVCQATFHLTSSPGGGRARAAVWAALAVSLLAAPAVLALAALVPVTPGGG